MSFGPSDHPCRRTGRGLGDCLLIRWVCATASAPSVPLKSPGKRRLWAVPSPKSLEPVSGMSSNGPFSEQFVVLATSSQRFPWTSFNSSVRPAPVAWPLLCESRLNCRQSGFLGKQLFLFFLFEVPNQPRRPWEETNAAVIGSKRCANRISSPVNSSQRWAVDSGGVRWQN